jgi:ubiquinone/menaquinone biosynthesis C-methylase UbiE
MSLRKRLFAWLFHRFLGGLPDEADPLIREIRRPLIAQARGDVLEIGAGDGANLLLYAPDVRLTLLDPNPYLLRHIPPLTAQLGHATSPLVVGVAERLPFPAARFDTIVSTHVLCSVRDLEQALAEIRRVLRPRGRFLFLEHVAASPDTSTFRLQRVINPVWRTVGDGCNLTRDIGHVITTTGFRAVKLHTYQADYPAFVSPHVFGTAEV